jgi:hypothetical protein
MLQKLRSVLRGSSLLIQWSCLDRFLCRCDEQSTPLSLFVLVPCRLVPAVPYRSTALPGNTAVASAAIEGSTVWFKKNPRERGLKSSRPRELTAGDQGGGARIWTPCKKPSQKTGDLRRQQMVASLSPYSCLQPRKNRSKPCSYGRIFLGNHKKAPPPPRVVFSGSHCTTTMSTGIRWTWVQR